jgi:MEDS: MEthanogen/methylotroph, DcmR Sensory domain
LIEAQNIGKPARETMRQNTFDLTVGELAPLSHWSGTGEPEHFVQFYEADTYLLDSLSSFIGAGLGEGDACIVVATREHREGLDERLQAYGLDVDAARSSGQFVSLDAAEVLSKFLVDGQPEPGRFSEVVGGLVARTGEGRPRTRIFGEMVALLWADGRRDAAIRLEELWNNLRKTRSFSLFCAYPMNGFDGQSLAAGGLSDVCAGHSRVIPAESYTALTNADDHYPDGVRGRCADRWLCC